MRGNQASKRKLKRMMILLALMMAWLIIMLSTHLGRKALLVLGKSKKIKSCSNLCLEEMRRASRNLNIETKKWTSSPKNPFLLSSLAHRIQITWKANTKRIKLVNRLQIPIKKSKTLKLENKNSFRNFLCWLNKLNWKLLRQLRKYRS